MECKNAIRYLVCLTQCNRVEDVRIEVQTIGVWDLAIGCCDMGPTHEFGETGTGCTGRGILDGHRAQP
jgi:hypothetical protein